MRNVLIGAPLVVACLAGAAAAVAPNPTPLVLICLIGLFGAQAASEWCPRGQSFRWWLLQHKIGWLRLRRRLAGTIRKR